ncbi:MAG TPA: STAS/SEC14 domain-containing protein [Candidatus Thermoplasmatota archaeon]|nr:STAS/SEC14 domain-containing protein [Candidatus Thermoplasmatota archaeon]
MRLPSPPYLVAEWDARGRVLDIAYAEETVLTDAMGDETAAWLDRVLREQGPHLAILVDAKNVRDASAAYRQKLGSWFRDHRQTTRMAVYNLTPLVRVMALLFGKATRFPMKIAGSREEALRWLMPVSMP